jgi:S1-C subfamily serine protease
MIDESAIIADYTLKMRGSATYLFVNGKRSAVMGRNNEMFTKRPGNKIGLYLKVVNTFAALTLIFAAGFVVGQNQGRWRVPDAHADKNSRAKVNLPNFSSLARELKPSVVFVVISEKETAADSNLPKNHPPVPPGLKKGVGAGFIIDSDGYILTNNHVVSGAKKVEVVVAGGKRYKATIVGRDPQSDVALVKIDPDRKLAPVIMGDSDKAKTGEWVVAMGNPYGLENNVTVGVISGKGRELPEAPFVDFIQTDAAIYPGNSGGPLINLDGEVIGINTAVVPGTQLGFSIPINKVKEILPQLKKGGQVSRGFIGIGMEPLTQVPEKAAEEKGVLVVKVIDGAPSEAAGVRKNDIIIAFGDKKVDSPNDLARLVAASDPGHKTTLTVKRGDKKLTLKITIGETPKATQK